MLSDRDRIFWNLYGEESWDLDGARRPAATGTAPRT